MIGVIDLDLQLSNSVNLTAPNLEIMKIAEYYRQENHFCRLMDLNEDDFNGYDQVYCFSEIDNAASLLPPNLLGARGVQYGGTGFTNGVYIPFKNSLIDYTLPRARIYKEFLKQCYNDGIKTKVISHILDDTYYRIMAGNNKLPCPAINKNKRVFIYDRNLFCDNWQDIITDITEHKPSSIICIHPIICSTIGQFFEVRAQSKISRANNVILNAPIPYEDLPYLIKTYKKFFLAEITDSSNVFLNLGGTLSSNFQYFKDFIYKINLLYFFWSHGINIKVIYLPPQTGVHDPLENLSNVIATWSKELKNKKTINEKIVLKNKRKKSIAHEERDLLLKFYPQAKDLFDQTYTGISQRGYWRV